MFGHVRENALTKILEVVAENRLARGDLDGLALTHTKNAASNRSVMFQAGTVTPRQYADRECCQKIRMSGLYPESSGRILGANVADIVSFNCDGGGCGDD